MSRKSVPDGFTLVEVLVASALLLLVLDLLYVFLVPTMRMTLKGSTRSQLQLEGFSALETLARDLQRSAPGAWTWRDQAPVALGLARQDSVLPTGLKTWERSAVVYALLDRRLQRHQEPEPGADGGSPVRLGPARLAEVARLPAARTLATEVESFVCVPRGDCLELSLTLDRHVDRVVVRRTVWPRCGL